MLQQNTVPKYLENVIIKLNKLVVNSENLRFQMKVNGSIGLVPIVVNKLKNFI